LAVLGIVILAYGIGHVLRFNIMHVEPRSNKGLLSHSAKEIEYLGNVVRCKCITKEKKHTTNI
jgi:hypothetical protein